MCAVASPVAALPPLLAIGPELSVPKGRERALQALADLRQGVDPTARAKAAAARKITLADLAARWVEEHVRPKVKPRTARDYERLLAQRILPALGHIPVVQIEHADINRLHLSLARFPRRANYAVQVLHALLGFAELLGLRPRGSNPAKRIKKYRERARERFLSESEFARAGDGIAAAEKAGKISPHAAPGLRLALFTGARCGEVTAAQWSHVDWQRRLIRLPDSKLNEPRTVFFSDAAIEVLRSIPRVGPYVIAGALPGEPYKNVSRAWIIARKYAGLDDVRLHDLRHSYASLAAGQGLSLQMIGKLLGHKLPSTTARYAHLAREAASAANDQLGVILKAAIEKGAPQPASVIKLARRRRRD